LLLSSPRQKRSNITLSRRI